MKISYKNTCLLLGLIISVGLKAQFFQGIGLFGAGTYSRHMYKDANDNGALQHNSKYSLRWGAGLMVEMFPNEYVRWQSEFEYIKKGAKEKPSDGNTYRNKFDYFTFNNYVKVRFGEGYRGTPYMLIGPRVEYKFRQKNQIYEPIVNNFRQWNVTGAVGAGFEFVAYYPFKLYTEAFWNPDILKNYKKDNITTVNRTWELRLGCIYRFETREHCNTPRYSGEY